MNQRVMATSKGEKGVALNFALATPPVAPRSQLVNQITATNAEGFRNSQQRIHRNRAVSVFQKGNKNNRQPRFLCERLLCQSRLFAAVTDGFAQRASVFWNSRHAPYKQERPENNIYYSIILDLRTCGKKRRNASAILKAKGFMKGKTRILIVENDIPLALFMVNLLTQVSCDVEFAPNGKKGMEMAQERKFDLIALAVQLPDASAFDICRELKQRHISRKTPVVFISKQPCGKDRQRCLEAGAIDCIGKPFEATDFIFRIISHARAKSHPSDFSDQEHAPGHPKPSQYALMDQ